MELLQVTSIECDVANKWRAFFDYKDGDVLGSYYFKFDHEPTTEEINEQFVKWSEMREEEKRRIIEENKLKIDMLRQQIVSLGGAID